MSKPIWKRLAEQDKEINPYGQTDEYEKRLI